MKGSYLRILSQSLQSANGQTFAYAVAQPVECIAAASDNSGHSLRLQRTAAESQFWPSDAARNRVSIVRRKPSDFALKLEAGIQL
jgi:hypothetical protein